jgi:hypothetical protein
MNNILYNFLTYFENVIHPAAGKIEAQKNKRRNSKASNQVPASPDCLHIRAAVRSNNSIRRNPAP